MVVMSTAFAMDVPPVSINSFSYLQSKWRTPKAGVTGSNPVGRASKQKWAPCGPVFVYLVCPAQGGGRCSTKRVSVLDAAGAPKG